jgi:hypothetical protein
MENIAKIANPAAERLSSDQLHRREVTTSAGETIVAIFCSLILGVLILSVIIEDGAKSIFSRLESITFKLTKEIRNCFGIQ